MRDHDEAHEEIMLIFCYQLLGKEPPIREFDGQLDYMQAVNDIQVKHKEMFEHYWSLIRIQGRVFETDDGSYVFTCYNPLDNDEAKEMMTLAAFKLKLPRERCYYVGHNNTVIIPLIEKE